MVRIVAIPPVMRLKALAKSLKLTPLALSKRLPKVVKKSGRIECVLDGRLVIFSSVAKVVIPSSVALQMAASASQGRALSCREVDPEIGLVESTIKASRDGTIASAPVRTPVVVLLGHFDHGKTTLLDALGNRPSTVEAAGITQVVRTRRVNVRRWLLPKESNFSDGHATEDTNKVLRENLAVPAPNSAPAFDPINAATPAPTVEATFVDTPGQEIFHRLRLNGALGADVVVLVVDAQEGVGVTTDEAVGCAEDLRVKHVIVALNKADLVDASRLKQVEASLRDFVLLENCPMVPISALHRTGLDSLAEVLAHTFKECHGEAGTESIDSATAREDIASSTEVMCQALVFDLTTLKSEGPAIHVLVQEGALEVGQHFVAGMVRGRVRALRRLEDDDDDDDEFSSDSDHLNTHENGADNSASQLNSGSEDSPIGESRLSSGKKKGKRKKVRGAKSDNNKSSSNSSNSISSSSGQHRREVSVLRAGEAGLALVALDSDPAGRKKKRRGEIAKWSPVGEPLWGVSSDHAQAIQDARHAAMELELAVETAERLGVSVGVDDDEGEGKEEEDEEDEDECYGDEDELGEDRFDGSIENEGDLLRHSNPYIDEDQPIAAPRLVVIKAGSASAVATILDAIDDAKHDDEEDVDDSEFTKAKPAMSGTQAWLSGRQQRPVEVVLAQVGPVTTSDIELAHMAGAKSLHLFGLPKQPSQQHRGKKSISGPKSLVAAAAARRSVSLLYFDTIQELLDDVLDLKPIDSTPARESVYDRGGATFVK